MLLHYSAVGYLVQWCGLSIASHDILVVLHGTASLGVQHWYSIAPVCVISYHSACCVASLLQCIPLIVVYCIVI